MIFTKWFEKIDLNLHSTGIYKKYNENIVYGKVGLRMI
jgi:hypothetical protein